MLVELIGEELAQLYNEVEKLVLFTRGEAAIRMDHVEALTGHHRIYDAFEVIDAMIGGHAGQAVSRLRNMFEEDKSAEYTAVGAFAFHLRRMFQAKVLLEKRTNPDADRQATAHLGQQGPVLRPAPADLARPDRRLPGGACGD